MDSLLPESICHVVIILTRVECGIASHVATILMWTKCDIASHALAIIAMHQVFGHAASHKVSDLKFRMLFLLLRFDMIFMRQSKCSCPEPNIRNV